MRTFGISLEDYESMWIARVIARRSSRDGAAERFLGRTDLPNRFGQRLLCVQLAHTVTGQVSVTYLPPETIVRLC